MDLGKAYEPLALARRHIKSPGQEYPKTFSKEENGPKLGSGVTPYISLGEHGAYESGRLVA
jgi:hypothetical protein